MLSAMDAVVDDAMIAQTLEIMREEKARQNERNEHAHLRVARDALDRIVWTREYAFGKKLFAELKKEFSEIKSELEEMRDMCEDLQRSAKK